MKNPSEKLYLIADEEIYSVMMGEMGEFYLTTKENNKKIFGPFMDYTITTSKEFVGLDIRYNVHIFEDNILKNGKEVFERSLKDEKSNEMLFNHKLINNANNILIPTPIFMQGLVNKIKDVYHAGYFIKDNIRILDSNDIAHDIEYSLRSKGHCYLFNKKSEKEKISSFYPIKSSTILEIEEPLTYMAQIPGIEKAILMVEGTLISDDKKSIIFYSKDDYYFITVLKKDFYMKEIQIIKEVYGITI